MPVLFLFQSADKPPVTFKMKSVTLVIFSVLMIVCLTTAMESDKHQFDKDYKLIAQLLDVFKQLDKRGAICRDDFMDIMSFKSSNYCRRKRRDVVMPEDDE